MATTPSETPRAPATEPPPSSVRAPETSIPPAPRLSAPTPSAPPVERAPGVARPPSLDPSPPLLQLAACRDSHAVCCADCAGRDVTAEAVRDGAARRPHPPCRGSSAGSSRRHRLRPSRRHRRSCRPRPPRRGSSAENSRRHLPRLLPRRRSRRRHRAGRFASGDRLAAESTQPVAQGSPTRGSLEQLLGPGPYFLGGSST